MNIGLIGLGKMGYNIGAHMLDKDYKVHAYDVNQEAVEKFRGEGGEGFSSIKDMVSSLNEGPRVIWMMVPAGEITDQVIEEVTPLLDKGDILIDAGNSNYKKTLHHFETLQEKGIEFFDVGTSGGVSGARNGACFMIGGNSEVFPVIQPLFDDLAVTDGYHFAGKGGAGHFLKMIHNGIEYGMMAAIGEGFDLLEKSPFDYDYEGVAKVFNNGSVIRGWLMELMENAFSKDAKLDDIRGVMNSSGEGKWTVESALDFETAAPVIALSLMMRYRSQETDTFTGKVVAALRHEFGGHAVEKSE
ncbi:MULTISPECIES: phosphogluconate dehydrogenase (NAD(+)-dependent, decarboxylating) [Pontibacillus]|uniref:Decarboxylating 6-phosphogluconate dehydrogenase n=1 Tax=Pontibacillus chungwhensis TaxID=265426 RepID=A0ABY8UZZ5_9BACI|nr:MULTISPECIES: decarboxylating 6-phosphogluconate dehydrogenase [Pontibacillus]MCD5324608.1 decarboxylating 6-phosphogluconate dehydrogenase [Pontibacillus sp. HN14]WIF99097.1 decarboxylating 6-phosphogluconate dehydrogenase [Pontibacillus chungwhensis]